MVEYSVFCGQLRIKSAKMWVAGKTPGELLAIELLCDIRVVYDE